MITYRSLSVKTINIKYDNHSAKQLFGSIKEGNLVKCIFLIDIVGQQSKMGAFKAIMDTNKFFFLKKEKIYCYKNGTIDVPKKNTKKEIYCYLFKKINDIYKCKSLLGVFNIDSRKKFSTLDILNKYNISKKDAIDLFNELIIEKIRYDIKNKKI